MRNHVPGGRTVISSRRAQSRVPDWESVARLQVTYRIGAIGGALTAAHSLPGIGQRLSLSALFGIRSALRSSAIPMDISSTLRGAVIGTRWSHGSPPENLTATNVVRISYYDIV